MSHPSAPVAVPDIVTRIAAGRDVGAVWLNELGGVTFSLSHAGSEFVGAEFRSASGNNGHVMIPYGGTREPQAPPGVDPYARRVSDRPKQELTASYRKGYGDALAALKARFGIEPTRMLCNQMSPQLVGMLTEVTGMDGRVVRTGDRTGHLGGTDIIVGLDTLVREGAVDGPILVCASAAFGFSAGLLLPSES